MSNDIHHHAIVTSLNPLFARAEQEGLWFYHQDADGEEVWCSPGYLRQEQAEGRLILAPEHWELRNPALYMKKLIDDASAIVAEYNALARRLGFEETLALESHSSNPADRH